VLKFNLGFYLQCDDIVRVLKLVVFHMLLWLIFILKRQNNSKKGGIYEVYMLDKNK